MYRFFSLFCTCLALNSISGAVDQVKTQKTLSVYWVGNSLVRSITPTRLHKLVAEKGIDLQFGSQLKGGFSLVKNWESLEKGEVIRYWESNKPVGERFEPGRPDSDPLPKRFGSFWSAHKNHKWDALVLLPLLVPDREKEYEALGEFVDYAFEQTSTQQIYLFQSWIGLPLLRDAQGKRAGTGSVDYQAVWKGDVRKSGRLDGGLLTGVQPDYYKLIERTNDEFADKLGKPLRMIPFGDIVYELDKRLKAGRIPGLTELYERNPELIPSWDPALGDQAGANILYADRHHPVAAPHLDGTIATYIMGLMYYSVLTGQSPIGLSGEAYDFDDPRDEALRHSLQTAVWDVVRKHPYTGVKAQASIVSENKPQKTRSAQPASIRSGPAKLRNGTLSIARWKDDKIAAVSIFSSDGMIRSIKSQWRLENPDVAYDGFYRLGEKYSIPFTFFIPPRALDDQTYVAASGVTPVAQPAGAMGIWADWKHMNGAGHEIASHTYSHADLRADKQDPSKLRVDHDPEFELSQAIVAIEKNIGIRPISINPAYGPPAEHLRDLFRKFYPVVRGDQENEVVAAQHEDTATAADLIGKLDEAIVKGKWLRVAGHGIRTEMGRKEEAAPDFENNGKRWDGYRPVKYSVMEALCREIDEQRHKLYIAPVGDAVRYLKQRNQSRIEIGKESENRISVRLVHELDPKVYNLALTLKLSLNRGLAVKQITQAGKKLQAKQINNVILFDAIPNRGDITIHQN
ncbi:MAG: polysaccharide deacetylase family protein [Opitutales bacterium]